METEEALLQNQEMAVSLVVSSSTDRTLRNHSWVLDLHIPADTM